MFNLLLEDNKDVESWVKQLDQLIVKLRNSGKLKKDPELFKYIEQFYEDKIIPFTRHHYLVDKEMDSKYEDTIKNDIIDLIITLGNIK